MAQDVYVYWRGGLKDYHYLSPPRPFVVGEDESADVCVDGAWLGSGGPQQLSAPGTYTVGNLSIVVLSPRVEAAPSLPKHAVDRSALPAWLGSFALHGLFLVLFALLPPASAALSISNAHSDLRYCATLTLPDEVMPEPLPLASAEDGSDGEPVPAEQDPGSPKRRPTPASRSAAPPAVAAQPNESLARNAGIIGVLRSLAGPTTAGIYAAASAQGVEGDAISGLLAGGDGELGGLAMIGTGRGQQGGSAGTIGVGGLGTRGHCLGEHCGAGGHGKYGTSIGGLGRRDGRVPPRVRTEGASQVVGALSKEVIRRHIQRQLARVRHCYEQRLSAKPDLQGRVAVRFIIDPSGPVRTVMVAESTLRDREVEGCVSKVVGQMSFPAPGGIVSVTYPFTFVQGP